MENIKIKYLVVVDIQNDFVTGVLGSKEAQAIVPNVMKKLKNYKEYDKIFFTRDSHNDAIYLDTLEGKYLPVKHCIYNTEGFELIDCINEFINEHDAWNFVYDKSSFNSEDLISELVYKCRTHLVGCDPSYDSVEVEFIGLCTDICVISNAIGFKNAISADSNLCYEDIVVKCDSSCCAGSTPEKHVAALEVMKSCHIEVY